METRRVSEREKDRRERDPDNARGDCLVENTYTQSTHKQVERQRE